MTGAEGKADLHRYLREAREAVLWKLEGLSEYDLRRPMTSTGTNLLGLVKHLSNVELLYFGFAFDRPFGEPPPWFGPASVPNQDMWATAEESREYVVETYRRACAHADATIEALDPEAAGHVPWWPAERGPVVLRRVLVHVVAECHRHAGHADVVRELIDGAAGLRDGDDFLPPVDRAWWAEYRGKVEEAALAATG